LASRPQNTPQVKELFTPTLYFSDTIFAAGLYECFDPNHPTTPADNLRYKQQLCDYLRGQFGLFGSEEGREWGVAHADYFEGLMSHRTHFQRPSDMDLIIPLFELVYGDAIPIYAHQSDRPRPDKTLIDVVVNTWPFLSLLVQDAAVMVTNTKAVWRCWMLLVAALATDLTLAADDASPSVPRAVWLGQDGHDYCQTATSPKPNDIQDLHLRLEGLSAGEKIEGILIRRAGGGE